MSFERSTLRRSSRVGQRAFVQLVASAAWPRRLTCDRTSGVLRSRGRGVGPRSRVRGASRVSTDEVYGDVTAPAIETDPLRPSSPYSASKAPGDLRALSYVRTHGLDAVITRGSNTYGPRRYPEKLIPLALEKIEAGEVVPVYGDGHQSRDWLWVEDHCEAIELVLNEGRTGEVYDVGTGVETTNLDLVSRLTNRIVFVDDRLGHDRRYALDTTKIRELGWKPQTSLETAWLD